MYRYEYDAAPDRLAGFKEGFMEGFMEGFKEGFMEGFKEGKIETVKQMVKVGTPMHFIEAATGWTREQILSVVNKKQ